MKLSIKHMDNERLTTITIVTAIIMVISCIFIPVISVFIFQDVLFFSRDNWFLTAPLSAYFMFGFGMLWIPIILTALLLTKLQLEKSGKDFNLTWLFSFLLLGCIPIMGLGIYNYYYFNEDGIHYNHLFTFSESSYYWEDISTVQAIEEEHGNSTSSILEHVFIMESGEKLTIPFNHDYVSNRRLINEVIDYYDITTLERKFLNE